MATRKKKTWTRRTDDEKRELLAQAKPGESIASLAARLGINSQMMLRWRAELGSKLPRKLAPAETSHHKGLTNGHASPAKPKLEVVGLVEAVLVELRPVIERELPRAITRAMAKAYNTEGESEG